MLVYLDQNKWIDIAKAFHGKDKSARAKRILRAFVEAGQVLHLAFHD